MRPEGLRTKSCWPWSRSSLSLTKYSAVNSHLGGRGQSRTAVPGLEDRSPFPLDDAPLALPKPGGPARTRTVIAGLGNPYLLLLDDRPVVGADRIELSSSDLKGRRSPV